MRKATHWPATVLLLVGIGISHANAGPLDETCDQIYKKLGSGPYEKLKRSTERFTHDGKSYLGCVVNLIGKNAQTTVAQDPNRLLGSTMSYCPDGKPQSWQKQAELNESGWCGDQMSGGPDGTGYRAFKENVFCIVTASWDGGDDSNPKYVPSPHIAITVQCALRD